MENASLNMSWGGNANVTGTMWYDPKWYQPVLREYYPVYTSYWQDNKIEKAFKIMKVLVDKKLIEPKTVKEFIELVNDIAKEI